jgi:hypothetical protein
VVAKAGLSGCLATMTTTSSLRYAKASCKASGVVKLVVKGLSGCLATTTTTSSLRYA